MGWQVGIKTRNSAKVVRVHSKSVQHTVAPPRTVEESHEGNFLSLASSDEASATQVVKAMMRLIKLRGGKPELFEEEVQ
jgi:hypothetical protein